MRAKAGFTLIEALAVLGITALVVSLMYTVGMRGVFTGFRLGNRAIATADTEIDKLAYRDVIDSLVIPPIVIQAQAAELELEEVLDDTFAGAAGEVSGHFIATRDTPCARAGAEGRITLALETDETATTVFCALGEEEPVALVELRLANAAFSFSEDGSAWYDEWLVERGEPVETQVLPNGELRKVLIRLASEDGRSEVIALASSGRALPQTPPPTGGGGAGGGAGGGQGQQNGPGLVPGGRGGPGAGGPPEGGRGGGRGGGGRGGRDG